MVFKLRSQSRLLGVDVGTASIKIVELKHGGDVYELVNYGELKNYGYFERLNNAIQTSSLKMLDEEVASLIKKILKSADINTRRAVFSLPIFSTFITVIEIKGVTEKELSSAVLFQARQYVPVPIAEVSLNWIVLEKEVGEAGDENSGLKKKEESFLDKLNILGGDKRISRVKILLVAAPKEIINKYGRISQEVDLDMEILESESFSMARSLLSSGESAAILDIGARNTNIIVAHQGKVRATHSIDVAGGAITRLMSRSLNLNFLRAEELKKKQGLRREGGEAESSSIIVPVVDKIAEELDKLMSAFSRKNINIPKIVLSGGGANMPGLVDYFVNRFVIQVEVGNPFLNAEYPEKLGPIIRDIGPSFAVAAGAAMRRG